MDGWSFQYVILCITFVAVILYDAISPKFRRAVWQRLWLLHNFLYLDDVEDADLTSVSIPGWKLWALATLAILQCIVWLGQFVFSAVLGNQVYAPLLSTAVWSYVVLRITFLHPPQTAPYIPALLAVQTIVAFISWSFTLLDILRLLPSILFIYVAGTYPFSVVLPVPFVARPKDRPSATLTGPEDAVSFWEWSTFSFVQPILDLAMERTLHGPDIWSLSPFFAHKNLFKKCLEYRSKYPKHSLLRFLLASNSLDLIIDLGLEFSHVLIGFIPPWALKNVLSALSSESSEPKSSAYYWTAVTFIAHLCLAQGDLFQRWHTRRCYERTRGQLFCTLHYKSLKRRDFSGKVGDEASADLGKIVNLMQGDAYAVSQRFWEFSAVFAAPVRLIIALALLYNVLGWSALSGVAVVLFVWVLNYPLARYNIYITRFSWKAKDHRMSTVNELLQNIRFLKFYGWENRWKEKAQDARETELDWRIKENIVSTLTSFIWTWMPSATALVSFLCYTLIAHERLTLSVAFPAIALFSQLQEPMTALPGQVFAMLHAYVSMQRIEAFLEEGNVPDWVSTLQTDNKQAESDESSNAQLGFKDATFEWHASPKSDLGPSEPAPFVLGPVDVLFPVGKLSLVKGATASGKSALLTSLLGEMHCLSGNVVINKLNHRIAYCAQTPWLEHATIRDNILFGTKYEEERYQRVVEACALTRDLGVFEAGDLTEVGERGITVSGGQRARIALARAFYSQAKCILLDDPLAAVDMHTAQHIVEHCLSSDLAHDRTIILVTHHISVCLSSASYLVELSHGKIIRQGSIESLRDGGVLQKVIEEEETEFVAEDVPEPVNEADVLTKDKDKVEPHGVAKTPNAGKLVQEEMRAEGRVSWQTYVTYIRSAGIFSWVATILLMLLIRAINIGNQFFLARWGNAYSQVSEDTAYLPSPDVDVRPWLLIYFYISMAGAISVLAYIGIGYYSSLQGSRVLFTALLKRLTKAPARFYDTTPLGRILNRFTTDIGTVDGALNNSARAALSGLLGFVASFGVIVFVVPQFTPFAVVIAWLYIRLAPPYVQASRDLRRLESVSLSPAFAGFDELLRGLTHVRAFGMEQKYQDRFYKKVDLFQSYDHAYWLVAGWLRWRYDALGSVVVAIVTFFALWNDIGDGATAVVIVQAGIFAEASRQVVRVLAQLELDFNSVERIVEYLEIPQEAASIIDDNRPPAYWPSSTGELVVKDLVVRYAPDLPPALNRLSFTARPGEKVAVVGRTGSGKSTLALALLRMVTLEGSIIIDGIDISKIGLEDLRSQITIVSQDVSLFTGTLRINLDPFAEFSDGELWDVLERCHLRSLLSRSHADGELSLDMDISPTGLSAGESQLIAFARAILRRKNIIIFDEATSQIDAELDDQIQKIIRQELPDAIVISIAHRLKTVIDYDRVLVLEDGQLVEFGTPKELLQQSSGRGLFRDMCHRSSDWPLLEATFVNEPR